MMQSDGEKELVLGNKQLISLFFVVVALCGVFFAMGYLIGRNSTKGTLAGAGTSTDATAVNAAPAPAPSPEPSAETSQSESPANANNPGEPEARPSPAVKTQPALDTPGPASASPSAMTAAPAGAIVTPESGATYLQVTALRRGDADNLVKTLREQSLPAVVAASSKPDLFRVLVGPYHETAQVADAKDKLKGLGFANAFVQKQ